MEGRSLRDCLLESVDDYDHIVKQILDSLLNRDKYQRAGESLSLTQLVHLVDGKHQEMKELLSKVTQFREREKLIRRLEECVSNRNAVIENIEGNLKVAETALTAAVYQANKKLQSVRAAEAHTVDSEEVIKFAHQISKSYSVAAPLFWQQGDPSRPFPTEPEFRNCAPRTNSSAAPAQPMSLLRTQGNIPGNIRTPPAAGPTGRVASPMMPNMGGGQGPPKQWPGSASPRVGYPTSSSSPRGRGGMTSYGSRAGSEVSPFQRKSTQNSPRLVSPSVNLTGTAAPRLAQPVNTVEQMSSDSSSSSSSEDESPHA